MQERRTTTRLSHRCHAQYCPAEDLVPRDGYLINISERGAGLLAREGHREGERITASFRLPGQKDPLTATGLLRWSRADGVRGRWKPLGIEWLPLEETARGHLLQFLNQALRVRTGPPLRKQAIVRQIALLATVSVIAAVGLSLCFWISALQEENRYLAVTAAQREEAIQFLELEEDRLKSQLDGTRLELEATRTQLAATAGEVTRLEQQTQSLGTEVGQLSEDVERFQRSYVQISEEREQLMQRVLDLEQERATLAKRLSSVEELREAIRDAIDTRREAKERERRSVLQARRERQTEWLANGNRGFLIRDGQPTIGHATGWIRVLQPEAIAPQAESGSDDSAIRTDPPHRLHSRWGPGHAQGWDSVRGRDTSPAHGHSGRGGSEPQASVGRGNLWFPLRVEWVLTPQVLLPASRSARGAQGSSKAR